MANTVMSDDHEERDVVTQRSVELSCCCHPHCMLSGRAAVPA